MSTCVGFVRFKDGEQLFIVFHHTVDTAYPYLYKTPEEAWEDYNNDFKSRGKAEDELDIITLEDEDLEDEEPVYLYSDLDLTDEYAFTTLVSRKKMRITSYLEGSQDRCDWINIFEKIEKLCQTLQKNKIDVKIHLIESGQPMGQPPDLLLYVTNASLIINKENISDLPKKALWEQICNSHEYWDTDTDGFVEDLIPRLLNHFKKYQISYSKEIIIWEESRWNEITKTREWKL